MRFVRSAVRALIVKDGRLLTIEMSRNGKDIFYILPGGGQLHGETLEQSLRRECREEIGVEPEVCQIAYVREYIGRNHKFRQAHKDFHQLEVVFHCKLNGKVQPGEGIEHDKHQIGIRWIPLSELAQTELYPAELKNHIHGERFALDGTYLGDIN